MKGSEAVKKQDTKSYIVVVGTSAGGLSALTRFVSQLQEDFTAPVLVVQHISADATGDVLLDALSKHSKLKCQHAENGMLLSPGELYLAPSDHHLMISGKGTILITKGAQENRSRPAIDPLFRSDAVAFRNRAIGVLLTGYLDDGTSGLKVIQRCGGTCIVQDPFDADYPDVSQNAIKVDYCLPIAEMGSLLYKLIAREAGEPGPVPEEVLIEAKIAERVLSGVASPYVCPAMRSIHA